MLDVALFVLLQIFKFLESGNWGGNPGKSNTENPHGEPLPWDEGTADVGIARQERYREKADSGKGSVYPEKGRSYFRSKVGS